jgi:hypothetical protein
LAKTLAPSLRRYLAKREPTKLLIPVMNTFLFFKLIFVSPIRSGQFNPTAKFNYSPGNTQPMGYRIEAGALEMVDTGNRYFSDNKFFSSGLN